jgi:hypothetical protein
VSRISSSSGLPPDHASAGITTAQLFELAYTAVAATPASTPTTLPMTARRIDSLPETEAVERPRRSGPRGEHVGRRADVHLVRRSGLAVCASSDCTAAS